MESVYDRVNGAAMRVTRDITDNRISQDLWNHVNHVLWSKVYDGVCEDVKYRIVREVFPTTK